MDGFEYRDHLLHVDQIPVSALADAVGTPTYIYSASGIRQAYGRVQQAFAPLKTRLHYAVKASANLHLCKFIRQLGAGMDVVSGGELERAWLAGTPMKEIVFAGVGKTDSEIRAALAGKHSPLVGQNKLTGDRIVEDRGTVGFFNVESESELERVASIAAEIGVSASVCLRVNPDVDAHTHEYTTTGKEENKFGIDFSLVPGFFDRYRSHPHISILGLHVHIGSPVRQVKPYVEAVQVLLSLIADLEALGHAISVLNLGGGWAVDYEEGEAPPIDAYAAAITPLLAQRVADGLQILIEPGRSIVANAGVLLTRVQHVKQGRKKQFAICDAGMHSLIRPALYRAHHRVWPAEDRSSASDPLARYDVVGPICETGDFLALDRELPTIHRGDLLAVFSAGAYGMSLASNYNTHGLPAEVLVESDRATLIGDRQSIGAVLTRETHSRDLALVGSEEAI
jgi:diaminopimelate decarboxylase